MGTIECCEVSDPQLRVSLQQTKGFMLNNPQGYNFMVTEFQTFKTKAKLYGDIFMKKNEGRNQFILQMFTSSRGSQVVNVPMRIYTDAMDHAEKKKMLVLDTPISDPNDVTQMFFLGQEATNRFIYKIVPFNRYEEESFKKLVYEVHMQKKITALKCTYLHGIMDEYVIESGIDKQANDKCCVVVCEHGMATLHQIVGYRKQTNCQWTQSEFLTLMHNLLEGLTVLHANRIVHRSIRPHNVLYSGYKGVFMLGGFRHSKILSKKQNETHPIVGVPYYANPELKAFMKEDIFTDFASFNCCDSDIYALGMTLASCFFLELTLPSTIITQALSRYQKQYPFLQVIQNMLKPNPLSLNILLQQLPTPPPRKLREQNLIETLRFKSKPQDQEFVSHRKAIADGYYHMFMYGHWAVEINQVVSYYELKGDKVQLAEVYKTMGDIYSQHRQTQSIEEYYGKAARLFSQIGQDSINQKRLQEGIRFLERGIECNRKAMRGQENFDLALLLNRLAMAHHHKGEYQIAKAFQQEALQMTGKTKSTNSLEYAKMALDAAKIQTEFLNLKQADIQLKASLRILETRPQDNQTLRLKALALEALGNNYRMKAIEKKHKVNQYREKAEQCILDALEISQKLKGNGDIMIAGILTSLGNVYFDKRDFHNAKKTYDRALIIKKNVLPHESLQIGQGLTYLANCYKSLKEYNEAIKHYDEAVEVFRACYGNDHNHNTAVAIGNIGLVYKDLGNLKQARQYLNLGKKILKDLYGEDCPDYQYFNQQL